MENCFIKICILIFIFLNIQLPGSVGQQNVTLSRAKRYLDFIEGTRMFYRVNGKNNLMVMSIFAFAWGYRANTPILLNKDARPIRRDTYHMLHHMLERSGIDGGACMLKAYCAAHLEPEEGLGKGFLFKLLKHIFTLDEQDKRHLPYLRHENCHQLMHSHCPFSFDSISPYTDDV